jgi:hypothetical protein
MDIYVNPTLISILRMTKLSTTSEIPLLWNPTKWLAENPWGELKSEITIYDIHLAYDRQTYTVRYLGLIATITTAQISVFAHNSNNLSNIIHLYLHHDFITSRYLESLSLSVLQDIWCLIDIYDTLQVYQTHDSTGMVIGWYRTTCPIAWYLSCSYHEKNATRNDNTLWPL